MCAAAAVQAYAPTLASADDETEYISEVYLSYGKDDAGWKKAQTEMQEKLKDYKQRSVYTGILRSAFSGGGVALTNEARNMQAATGSSFDNGILGSRHFLSGSSRHR